MKLPAAWLCCLLLTSPAWAADTVVTGKVYLERDGKPGAVRPIRAWPGCRSPTARR